MSQDNSYEFNNRTTVLTLRHNIGEQIKGVKIRFTNAEGETVEYEDNNVVGEHLDNPSTMRRGLNMAYKGLEINGKFYNVIIEGTADSNLDQLNVTATVQQIGKAGNVELEDPDYSIELIF